MAEDVKTVCDVSVDDVVKKTPKKRSKSLKLGKSAQSVLARLRGTSPGRRQVYRVSRAAAEITASAASDENENEISPSSHDFKCSSDEEIWGDNCGGVTENRAAAQDDRSFNRLRQSGCGGDSGDMVAEPLRKIAAGGGGGAAGNQRKRFSSVEPAGNLTSWLSNLSIFGRSKTPEVSRKLRSRDRLMCDSVKSLNNLSTTSPKLITNGDRSRSREQVELCGFRRKGSQAQERNKKLSHVLLGPGNSASEIYRPKGKGGYGRKLSLPPFNALEHLEVG